MSPTPEGGSSPADGPAGAQASFTSGLAHAGAGDWQRAAHCFEQALARAPLDASLWLNLAHARLRLDDAAGGATAARRALALDPRSELGLNLALQCLQRAGRLDELVELFGSVERKSIRDPNLHLQLGMALFRLGRLRDAVTAYFDALQRDPRNAAAYAQLGNVFQMLHLPLEARESFRNAQALGRDGVEMAAAIFFTSLEACDWSALAAEQAALERLVAEGRGQPLPFFSLNLPWSRAQLRAAAQAQAAASFAGIAPLPAAPRRGAGAPIRVGYVSADLQSHATAQLIAELFERHDRERVVPYAYSYGADDGSPMRRRIEAAFAGRFLDTRALAPAALAQRVRADGIDVLVDLKGWTLLARNEVFAYRAAPVQVNFLGFPGTLGSHHYDYLIGDPVVTPLAHAAGYAEKIAQLPGCYQPNDRQRPLVPAASRAACGLPEAAFVFACFNANYKITPALFDHWCALLRAVDDAVLWLYVANPQARAGLAAAARARGIDPARLVWAEHCEGPAHLARIQAADLFLDTAPVNAHTTASDALWAGLPLLTTLGECFAGRVAASLLTAVGLTELIAQDGADYRHRALALARDRDHLARLRERLRMARERSPLFDSAAYARDFDALLARMVERQAQGLAPEHLPAAR
jgi:predicted O-linked N-acetylglucosamine transferase (SPINDLY family)